MNRQIPLPLTQTELARLHKAIEKNAGQPGFICMYMEEAAQIFVILIADGKPAGWVVSSAPPDKEAVSLLGDRLCAGLSYAFGLVERRDWVSAGADLSERLY